MTRNRVLKQIIYGTIYLIFFGVIGTGIYLAFIKPKPTCSDGILNQEEEQIDCGGPHCIPCAIARLAPLKIFSAGFFDAGAGKTTALIKIQNPNQNYGANKLSYDLILYGARNEKLFLLTSESFIYPGERKNIVLPALPADFPLIVRSELYIHDISWQENVKMIMPEIELKNIVTRVAGLEAVVEGSVVNNGARALPEITIGAFTANKDGAPLSASKTVVSGLAAFQEKTFKIFMPVTDKEAQLVDKSKTQVFAETLR